MILGLFVYDHELVSRIQKSEIIIPLAFSR